MTPLEKEITKNFTVSHAIQTIEALDEGLCEAWNKESYGTNKFKAMQSISNNLRKAYIALNKVKDELNQIP